MTPENHRNYINAAKMLRINVGFILAQPVGSSSESQVEIPTPLLVSGDLILEHLYLSLRLTHAHHGVVVRGHAETSVETECSRCMDEIPLPIEFEFEEVFASDSTLDTPYRVDDSANIDLAPLLREETLLNIPMVTPVDEQKRCLFCERRFEDILREYGLIDDIDPRFEALRSLLTNQDDTEE